MVERGAGVSRGELERVVQQIAQRLGQAFRLDRDGCAGDILR